MEVPTDILHPELYRALSEWRTAKTREMNVPAYVIMQQKALMGIVNLLPDSPRALEAIPYFGAKGVERYGLEILGIIRMAGDRGPLSVSGRRNHHFDLGVWISEFPGNA